MFQPPESEDYEFVELQNISTNTVSLYDDNIWWSRLMVSGEIGFDFPIGATI